MRRFTKRRRATGIAYGFIRHRRRRNFDSRRRHGGYREEIEIPVLEQRTGQAGILRVGNPATLNFGSFLCNLRVSAVNHYAWLGPYGSGATTATGMFYHVAAHE